MGAGVFQSVLPGDTALPTADASRDVPVAVCARRMGKTIDDRPILRDVSLELPMGSYLAVLGANGAGKSTLLHLLATLSVPSAGELDLFGQPVHRGSAGLRRRIGMIGHQPMLYQELSALENLVFFGRLYDVPQPRQRAGQLLARVGLADRADDAVKTFSRGMTQRLSIARALMHQPQLLLADEPFSGLDLPSLRNLETLLAQLHQAGMTIVLTNHDVGQSLRLAQRVMVLRRGRVVVQASAPTAVEADIVKEMLPQ